MFWQLFANGLVTGSVIAIAAAGVSLVYGILRLVNFAYGDFMAFGALAAYAFNGPLGVGMIASALLGMLATAILSLALDVTLWRPLRARRAGFMSLFLASIGLALVLRQVLLLAYGPQPQSYAVDQYKVYVIDRIALRLGSVREQERSEEHTSELQSQSNNVCRLLLEKKKKRGFFHSDRDSHRDSVQPIGGLIAGVGVRCELHRLGSTAAGLHAAPELHAPCIRICSHV